MALEDDAVKTGEYSDDHAGKLGDEARQRLHGVLLRTGAGANPILAGGRRSCSTYLVAALPRWGGGEWKTRPLWGRTSVSTYPMGLHPGDLALIFSPEQAVLKAQEQFEALRDFVQKAAHDGQRIDTVERELFRQLLGLGHTLLSAFVVQQGEGDLGPQVETAEGQIARRLPERHDRRYVSIF